MVIMQDNYIKILIPNGSEVELHTIDITNFSITELSQLKEIILKEAIYTDSVVLLDRLIREKAEEMTISSNIPNKSYIKIYKENKKQQKNKKRGKYRRR